MYFATVKIPKVEKSYQICAMQKVSMIFSNNLQFGTLKLIYLQICFCKKKIHGVDSPTAL